MKSSVIRKIFFITSLFTLLSSCIQKESFLYIKQGNSAIYDGSTLTMQISNNKMTYFSDRPYRDANVAHLESFTKMWDQGKDSFSKDNPNAAFTYKDNDENVAVIELSNPKLTNKTISFKIKILEGSIPKNKTLLSPVLFIDSGHRLKM